MKCKEFRKELISGSISREGYAHRDSCSDCRQLYYQVNSALEQLDEDRLEQTNPFFATRVVQRLENRKESRSIRQLKPAFLQIANAISIFIAGLFIGLLFLKNIDAPVRFFDPPEQRQETIRQFMDAHYLDADPHRMQIMDKLKRVSRQKEQK